MSVTFPIGFRAAASTAGIKPSGRADVALIARDSELPFPDGRGGGKGEKGAAPLAASAACYTQNAIVGAPVAIGLAHRAAILSGSGRPHRAILINAGNSNAATGEQGLRDATACMSAVAKILGCTPDEVLPSSTGVIGRLLPTAKILNEVTALVTTLARGERADAAAAAAIMTTDLVPKTAQREVHIDGRAIRIGAIAKGSGMIAPRLDSAFAPPTPAATMLAFITTDAAIASRDLQAALESSSRESFDRISVDNHPSCSDTLVCLASGMASPSLREGAGGRAAGDSLQPMPPITRDSQAFKQFSAALQDLCEDLATQIVTDGEGATRTFRVTIRGTRTVAEAEAMAREVVNSPLVKCAIHGQDPNWGRIVTAAGNAGVKFDPRHASLKIGPVEVYRAGVPIPAALDDHRLKDAMSAKRVECDLTVGTGPASAWMIGCDLSSQYVSINADYTT